MITATFNHYYKGETTKHEVALRTHVTRTGEEDHFESAHHDAEMILTGMKLASPDARWTITKIDMGY